MSNLSQLSQPLGSPATQLAQQAQQAPSQVPQMLQQGTVTLFGMCCSRGVFGHAYLNRVGAVCGSGSGVECGDIVPLSESVCHLGSPLGGTESMASWSKMP